MWWQCITHALKYHSNTTASMVLRAFSVYALLIQQYKDTSAVRKFLYFKPLIPWPLGHGTCDALGQIKRNSKSGAYLWDRLSELSGYYIVWNREIWLFGVHSWVCLHKLENHSKAGYLYQYCLLCGDGVSSAWAASNSYFIPPKLNAQ